MVKQVRNLDLNGMTPQRVIRLMNDIIGRAKLDEKRFLRIEEYRDNLGNPFEPNPDKYLRVVIIDPEEKN